MSVNRQRRRGGRGFTLIELMVVMGLIILLVGGFSTALRPTSEHALRAAQLQVAGLLERARLVAVGEQADARLVIDASDSERFMRLLQVFALDALGTWKAAGPAVWLPRGVTLVPPSGLTASTDPWANFAGPRSVLATDLAPHLASEEFEGVTRTVYVEYLANGETRPAAGGQSSIAIGLPGGSPRAASTSDAGVTRMLIIPSSGAVAFGTTGHSHE